MSPASGWSRHGGNAIEASPNNSHAPLTCRSPPSIVHALRVLPAASLTTYFGPLVAPTRLLHCQACSWELLHSLNCAPRPPLTLPYAACFHSAYYKVFLRKCGLTSKRVWLFLRILFRNSKRGRFPICFAIQIGRRCQDGTKYHGVLC